MRRINALLDYLCRPFGYERCVIDGSPMFLVRGRDLIAVESAEDWFIKIPEKLLYDSPLLKTARIIRKTMLNEVQELGSEARPYSLTRLVLNLKDLRDKLQ